MSLDADRLFALLPAVYRTRDAAGGGQLRALFAVMAAQSGIVEDNINQLYDDQFIETCAPWVIPYIGDLIGYNSIYEVASASSDSRAEVANTIGYRRRKGTLLALEQLSMDVSGRAAVAVEEFRRLITTESMRHPRPGHDATVNLRHGRALSLEDTAFDVQNRTVDVRRIAPRSRTAADPDPAPLDIALHGPGRFNIPDLAIHLWRWQSWPVTNAPAVAAGGGRYRFSPLRNDMPLFSRPRSRTAFSSLTTRADVPLPIARHELADFYGPDASILLITDGVPVGAGQVYGANLADRPGGSWCTVADGQIAIDPELGRIQFAADVPLPQSLRVSYLYGFPAAIGGGPYDRSAALSQLAPADTDYVAIVGSAGCPDLGTAAAGWNQAPAGSSGLIVLPGFESLTADLTGQAALLLPAGSSLALVAGEEGPAGVTWKSSRVTITGDIEVTGVAGPPGGPATPGQLLISGAWIAGRLVVTGAPSAIKLADTTLVPGLGLLPDSDPLCPGDPSIVVKAQGTALALDRVISGPVAADPSGLPGSATASWTRHRRSTSPTPVPTWPVPEPTCTSRTARLSARSAPGPCPWRQTPSFTLAWAAATPGPQPSGPAAGRRVASGSACSPTTPSRHAATSACPRTPRPGPRSGPISSRNATGIPRTRCLAATCRWRSGPAPTTARRWASSARSRKPRRSPTSSCEPPSTCPLCWRAGSSSIRHDSSTNSRSRTLLTAPGQGATKAQLAPPESAPD